MVTDDMFDGSSGDGQLDRAPLHTDGGNEQAADSDRIADALADALADVPTAGDADDFDVAAADFESTLLPVRRSSNRPIRVDKIEAPRSALQEAVLADVTAYFADVSVDAEFAEPPPESFIEERFFSFDFLDEGEPVEHYWVNCPYAFITILFDEDENEYWYHVSEPVLDEFEEYVRLDLTKILRNSLLYRDIDRERDRQTIFEDETKAIIREHAATVADGTLHKLLYYLLRDFIDFGPIDPVIRDWTIEDISCDGDGIPVFVYHGGYRDLRTNVVFENGELASFTVRLAQRAGKPVSISDPLVDASLPDGSRIQLTLGTDVSTRGSNFTIRKFSEIPYTPVDLIRWNTFSIEEMAYFWLAIENNRSLIFAGGTGSGKTTSMNAVSFFIPENSKVVSIEDTREITLPHDNWIQSVTRETFTADGRGEINMYQLLQAALRQRPEYLLVGEIRTDPKVAHTFFQAISTGHTAYSTFHADSIDGAINRLGNEPLGIPAQMLDGLDIISIQRQVTEGGDRVRRNHDVTELVPSDVPNQVETRTVFERNPRADSHEQVEDSYVLAEVAADRGWSPDELQRQLQERVTVLTYLIENGITDYREVARTLHMYNKNPAAVMADVHDADGRVRDTAAADDEATSPADGGVDVPVETTADPTTDRQAGDDR